MHEPNGTQNGNGGPKGLVAVTGSTGFVGRAVVAELLGRGWSVRGLTRSLSKAGSVFGDMKDERATGRLTFVEGDALGEGIAGRLVKGADACVNLIGIIRETGGGQTFERVHTKTTRALVRACERGGVGRYLQMSALGVSDHGSCGYQTSKWAAERAVRNSSLAWTVFRPGLIHGARSEFIEMAKGWCEGREMPHVFIPCFNRVSKDWAPPAVVFPPVLPPELPKPPSFEDPVVAPVHVDDVARAFAESLERESAIGEVYPLVGSEELTMPELLKQIRDTLPLGKKSLRVVRIPGRLAAFKARAAAAVGMRDALPFDEGMALMGQEDSVASNAKASAHLSFQPVGFSESMPVYAASM